MVAITNGNSPRDQRKWLHKWKPVAVTIAAAIIAANSRVRHGALLAPHAHSTRC